jgi:GNAT superfamily N-acetyltransferase
MAYMAIRALAPALAADFLEFFDARAFADNPGWSDCYCRFFKARTLEEWDKLGAAENRAAAEKGVLSGEMSGYLAYVDGRAVGFCAADAKAAYPLLANYPGLPGKDDAGAAAIVCLVVEKAHRRKGIGKALVRAAVEGAERAGFRSIEAYPRAQIEERALSDAESYPGPASLYAGLGFARLREAGDRIVMSRTIRP